MSDLARLVLLNVGIACAGGFALAIVGVPRRQPWLPTLVGLAPATGIALVGIVTAFSAMVGIDVGLLAVAALTTAALGAAAAAARWGRGHIGSLAPRSSGPSGRLVELGFLVLLAGLSLAILRLAAATALTTWDGWAIWAPKAHALFADGDVWSPVFEDAEYFMQHQEYPIFLPGLDALSAEALGRFDPQLIDVEAGVVLLAFGAAVWALLRLVVHPAAAAAVAFALTGSAPLAVNAGANYADAVVAAFTALGLLLLLLWLARDGTTWLALAALFFGAGAVTKAEGLLFALAAILAALALAPRFGRTRRLVGAFALGCLAPSAVWSVVDRLNGPGAENVVVGRVADPSVLVDRVPPSVEAMAGELVAGWPLAMAAVAIALIAAAATRTWRGAVFVLAWAGLSFGALVAVYAFSPNPIDWHLGTSADRVVFSIALGLGAVAPVLAALAIEAAGTGATTTPSPETVQEGG